MSGVARRLAQTGNSCSGVALSFTQLSSSMRSINGVTTQTISGTVQLTNNNPYVYYYSQPTLQLNPSRPVAPVYQPLSCPLSSGMLSAYSQVPCTFSITLPANTQWSTMAAFIVPTNDQASKCYSSTANISGGGISYSSTTSSGGGSSSSVISSSSSFSSSSGGSAGSSVSSSSSIGN